MDGNLRICRAVLSGKHLRVLIVDVVFLFRFEIVFEGAGFEEVPLDETNLLVRRSTAAGQ